MSEKPAAPASDWMYVLFLVAFVVIGVGLEHYFGVPIGLTTSVVIGLFFILFAYLLYRLWRINQQAKKHIDGVMAQAFEKEKELRGYAQANGLDLSGLPTIEERIADRAEKKETEIRPIETKQRFGLLVSAPLFALFGYWAAGEALANLHAGVMTYSKKGPPKITYTVTAHDNALEFYTQIAFIGSLGLFILMMGTAILLMFPAIIFPSIDVAYRTRLRPLLKCLIYLGLPFGAVFILLLFLRPLIL